MADYMFGEYNDMVLVYGEVQGNGRAACQLYHERFPHRRQPVHTMFARLIRRLRDSGTLVVHRVGVGAGRTRRNVGFEDEVLRRIHENPSASSRAIAATIGTGHMSVWRVLQEQLFHPYHRQRVQALGPADFPPRVTFCRWFLPRCVGEPVFPRLVLFSDEACFSRDGVFNSRNMHHCERLNPHATWPRCFQQCFEVNVWAGIVDGRLIGPCILPHHLTAASYLIILQEVLPDLLDDVSLDTRRNMCFQHDGAPPHFAHVIRDYLGETFGDDGLGERVQWHGHQTHWTSFCGDI